MKSSFSLLTLALMAGLLVNVPANAADKAAKTSGKAVATVNGVAIPQAAYDLIANQAKQRGAPDGPDLEKEIKGRLIQAELLSQAAKKKGLERNPEVAQQLGMAQVQLDLARSQILASAYIADFLKANPVNDAAVKAEYDTLVKANAGKKEYKARHILVKEEKDAKDIIERLKKGEKFEDLAKLSVDEGSKAQGGDLGWANPAGFVEPFAKALTTQVTGTFSQTPVQTQHGYHVIQLDDIRDIKIPSLEEVKPQVTQRLQGKLVEQHLQELAKGAKIGN